MPQKTREAARRNGPPKKKKKTAKKKTFTKASAKGAIRSGMKAVRKKVRRR